MKKTGKVILIVLLAALLAGGGVYGYAAYTANKPVKAQRAGDWMLGYMPSASSLYGIAASDGMVTVTLEKDRRISEIKVKQGDTVKAGDPLVVYDLSRSALSVEEKQLKMGGLLTEIEAARKEYKKYAKEEYVLSIVTPTPVPSPTPRGKKAQGVSYQGGGTIAHLSASRETPPPDPIVEEIPAGTKEVVFTEASFEELRELAVKWGRQIEKDYVFTLKNGLKLTAVLKASKNGKYFFAVTGAEGTTDFDWPVNPWCERIKEDPALFSYGGAEKSIDAFRLLAKDWGNYVGLRNALYSVFFERTGVVTFRLTLRDEVTPVPTPTPVPTKDPDVTPTPYRGGGLSRSEREEMAEQLRQEIRSKEAEYRQLELDIEKLNRELSESVLYAEMDSVITECAEGAVEEGEVILVLRSGSGVYISCVMSEMERELYHVGDRLKGFSYDSGMTYSCVITEIGSMPLTESYDNGYGANSSAYIMRVDVEGTKKPEVGEFIDFSTGGTELDENAVYLYDAFLAEYEGRDCVYVVREGIVRREFVTTGGRVDRYVELNGITLKSDDFIVFPGERNCRDGARAEVKGA